MIFFLFWKNCSSNLWIFHWISNNNFRIFLGLHLKPKNVLLGVFWKSFGNISKHFLLTDLHNISYFWSRILLKKKKNNKRLQNHRLFVSAVFVFLHSSNRMFYLSRQYRKEVRKNKILTCNMPSIMFKSEE